MWNQLKHKYSDLYKEFKEMSSDEKKKIIDAVIEKKCIEKNKKNKFDGKASFIIMLEEIEKHVDSKRFHNRL